MLEHNDEPIQLVARGFCLFVSLECQIPRTLELTVAARKRFPIRAVEVAEPIVDLGTAVVYLSHERG